MNNEYIFTIANFSRVLEKLMVEQNIRGYLIYSTYDNTSGTKHNNNKLLDWDESKLESHSESFG